MVCFSPVSFGVIVMIIVRNYASCICEFFLAEITSSKKTKFVENLLKLTTANLLSVVMAVFIYLQ